MWTWYTLTNEKLALAWTANRTDFYSGSNPTFVPVVGGIIGEVHDATEEFAKVKEISVTGTVLNEVALLLSFLEERALVVKIGVHVHRDPHTIFL